MKQWLLFALLLFPILSFASATGGNSNNSGGVFSVPSTDKSMEYLSYAFGTVPGTPIQSDQVSASGKMPVLQNMFYIFNQIIFALGIMVVVYTTGVGTIKTAQEGEFLGKEWHPILIPLRAALGIFVLLPTSSGYNWIQMALLWFVVQGVGAANALWKQVIYYNQTQGSIHTDTRGSNLLQAGNTVYAIFTSNVCMTAMNADPTATNLLHEPISIYQWKNKVEWGRQSKAGKEEPLCGSVTIPDVTSNIFNAANDAANLDQRRAILTQAIFQAQAILEPAAMEALYGGGSISLGPSAFVSAAYTLNDAVRSLENTFETIDQLNQQAIDNGWIFAGSYYFQVIQGVGVPIIVTYSSKGVNADGIKQILGTSFGSQIIASSGAAADNYAATSSVQINVPISNQLQLQLNNVNSSGSVGSIFSAMFGGLMEDIVHSLDTQMTSGEKDPLLSMASFGAYLTTTCEIAFWSVLSIYFIIFMVVSVFHCFLPFGPALDIALRFFVPMAILAISLFYLAGITLALYVPLIPYLVFTFTAFGWMILVVETLLGASLVGLSLVIPSEDELGKAGHAVMILLGLFLRPALMILGFILAIQLLYIAFKMLNFGFWKTMVSSTGASNGVGVFGMVAVLLMYSGIAAALTHEAFSLIYVLPNKVMRWISGGGEEDVAGQKAKELKGSVEKGGGIAQKGMQGSLSSASSGGSQRLQGKK